MLVLQCCFLFGCATAPEPAAERQIPAEAGDVPDVNDAEPRDDSSLEQSGELDASSGVLDARAIREVVERRGHRVQECYQKWLDMLQENEELDHEAPPGGLLIVALEIGAGGEVESSIVLESEIEDEHLQRCITRETSRWRFPSPARDDLPLTVEIPFFLDPTVER